MNKRPTAARDLLQGHGFDRWQDKMVAYRKTEDFLARCLGGRTGGFDFFELGAKLF